MISQFRDDVSSWARILILAKEKTTEKPIAGSRGETKGQL
jgi:hypothetical protein